MIIGWVLVGATAVHTVAHYVNYSNVAADGGSSVWDNATKTPAGLTGNILTLVLLIMAGTALPAVRRSKRFDVFYIVHHLFFFFYIVLLAHGPDYVSKNFWKFLLGPILIYGVERARRLYETNADHSLRVVVAEACENGVTYLRIERPAKFKYVCGQ
jgi:DMSO/TMAO reductase YedYZ heme-binding membrane subunit